MKKWIMILAAALFLVILLVGCGAQSTADSQPAVPLQEGSKTADDGTQVEMIKPDDKLPTEVPAQELNKEEAPAAEPTAEAAPVKEPEEPAPAAEPVAEAVPEEEPAQEVPATDEDADPADEPAQEVEEEPVVVGVVLDVEEPETTEAPGAEEEEAPVAAPIAGEAASVDEALTSEDGEDAGEAETDDEPDATEEISTNSEIESSEFLKITGLTEVEQSLAAGECIVGITYTEGLGESGDWFYTTDPWEIQDLWTALQMIDTDGESGWFVTDWYPSVEIYLSDLSVYYVSFNGHWLDTPDCTYELKNDETFWTLTSLLKDKYKEAAMEEDEDEFFVPNSVDLYFPANPTTGYVWTIEVEDENIVAVEEQYIEDVEALGRIGAGGTQWIHFDGLMAGNTSVKVSYQRPWQEDDPLYSFVYRLSVDEKCNVVIWGVEMNQNME